MDERLLNDYFEWLLELINYEPFSTKKITPKYRNLLAELHSIEFYYTIADDKNRCSDGVNLRVRFINECGLDEDPAYYSGSCSVLEMLIALSDKCETHIMDNIELGNRTSTWFWIMIFNLNLSSQVNSNFNKNKTDAIIETFLSRTYSKNGEGGLFINNNVHDMRDVEIWYQICWYLNTIN